MQPSPIRFLFQLNYLVSLGHVGSQPNKSSDTLWTAACVIAIHPGHKVEEKERACELNNTAKPCPRAAVGSIDNFGTNMRWSYCSNFLIRWDLWYEQKSWLLFDRKKFWSEVCPRDEMLSAHHLLSKVKGNEAESNKSCGSIVVHSFSLKNRGSLKW